MLTRSCLLLAFFLGFGLLACGDDEDGGADSAGGGADPTGGAPSGGQGGAGGGVELSPPAAGITDCVDLFIDADGACRPSLAKCPLGSVPDIDAGCVAVGVPDCASEFIDERGVCLPAASDCAAGTFPVPSMGCVPIDGPNGCGAGTWGNVPDDPINVYVDASYEGGSSDGSLAQPFVTLDAALAVADAGSRVVLAAGTYSTDAPVTTELELRGVCASQVTLTAAEGAERVITLAAGPAETIVLSDVTVSASVAGIRVAQGSAEITRVEVRDVSHKAIEVGGAFTTASIDQLFLHDTTNGGQAQVGIAVQAIAGGEVSIQRSAIVRARTAALQSYNAGSVIVADDVFVADVQADSTGYGNSAAVQDDAEITLRGSVFRDTVGGVYVGADATIEDCVLGAVFDPQSDKITMTGGSLALKRSAVVDGDTWAITVYEGETGPALIEHVLVADIASGQYGGSGLSLSEPATVRASAFTRNVGPSITALKNTQIEGVVMEDTLHDVSIGVGAGIVALDGGLVSIDRSYFRGVEDAAVLLAENSGGRGAFALTRSRIEALPGIGGYAGIGVGLSAPNCTASIQDVVIDDVHAVGVLALETSLVMESSIVRGVAPNLINWLTLESEPMGPVADGVMYLGASADHGLTLTDVWIDGAERVGVTASAGAHAFTRVRMAGSEIGLALRDGATAAQTDCDLTDNDVATEDPSDVLVPAP